LKGALIYKRRKHQALGSPKIRRHGKFREKWGFFTYGDRNTLLDQCFTRFAGGVAKKKRVNIAYYIISISI
jgi:hypothetical protein